MAYIPPVTSGLTAGAGGGTALAGAAAIPGMQALLLPLLLSYGPAIFSKLFGGDPQQKLRDQIAALLSARHVGSVTNDFYRQVLSSPAYSSALGGIATGANQTANNVAASLAERGIGTTGTGAVLSGLTPSLVGSQQGKLKAEAYGSAQEAAMDSIRRQIEAITGTQGPSQTQKYLAGGIDAFRPYLTAWLKSRYPQLASVGG